MDGLRLRVCTLSDLDQLQVISIETFTDTFKEQNSASNLKQYLDGAYNKMKLASELTKAHSYFYFLEKEKQIVGYLKVNVEESQTETVTENALEIERIYIRKPYLRQGFGKYLIDAAETIARKYGKEKIWLGVWEYNERALLFYEKMGFKQITSHSFWLGDDEQTDIIVLKELVKE